MASQAEIIGAIDREIAFLVRIAESARREAGMLDRSAYLLLGELEARGPLGIGALAETFQMDISTASRQTMALRAKGLVERFPDPQDGRASLLAITPDGHAQLHATVQVRQAQYATFLAEWSEEECRRFAASLARFNRAIVQRRRTMKAVKR